MMDFDEDTSRQSRLFTGADDMESLVLDHSLAEEAAASSYRSTMGGSAVADRDPLATSRQYHGGDEFRIDDDPLVQPPSYEDVVGESSENGGVRRGENAGSAYASWKDTLEIRISDPQKVADPSGSMVPGGGTYVTYQVCTKTNIPQYAAREMVVRRRFRDFVTLADRLSEKYRGFFIPPRPDKNVVESQVMHSKEFVEMRRLALEKYLRRLAVHPVIRRSDELRIFLEAEGRLPLMPSTDMASRMLDGAVKLPRQLFGAESAVVPTPQEAAQPAKGGRDLLRMFRELRQSVSNEWGAKPVLAEEDKGFLQKKEKMVELEKHLTEASAKAEVLIKAQQELGDILGELGLSFIKLSKFEDSSAVTSEAQKSHAGDARRFGNSAVALSRQWRSSTGRTVHHLSQLHEYLGLMQAVHTALSDRQQALLTVQTLTADLAGKKERVEKLEAASRRVLGGDQARTRRIGELHKEIAAAEAGKEVAEREYEKIQERNEEELERIEAERNRDFYGMLEGFVRTQVDIAEKSATAWSAVAQDFAQSEASRPGGGKPGS